MDILITITKPKDITSQDAVTKVKKLLKVKKAGHTGTLDPMATGLMVICLNRATRLASYFSGLDKEYRAVMKLGETTDTQDAYGNVIEKKDDIRTDPDSVRDTLKSFEGNILQKPPMFSALKHKGKALYTYARKGIEIERKPREVNIRRIDVLDITLPYVTFTALCSKGTYIRTLCHDIGQELKTGAHLFELERTAAGHFRIEDSITFEELTDVSRGDHADKGFYTMDEALSWLPEFQIQESLVRSVTHGNPVRLNNVQPADDFKTAPGIRIKSPDGVLMAIGSYSALNNSIKMDVVLT